MNLFFRQCNASILDLVDNFGVLSLDLAWCYLQLGCLKQLADAERRLIQCEETFKKSYGSDLERVQAIKGTTGILIL